MQTFAFQPHPLDKKVHFTNFAPPPLAEDGFDPVLPYLVLDLGVNKTSTIATASRHVTIILSVVQIYMHSNHRKRVEDMNLK